MNPLSPIEELFGFLLPFLDHVPIIRVVLGFILVFLLPGFAWSLIFFRQISVIERIVFSFGLSIALVTLSILAMNMVFGIRITGLNSVLIITVITVVPIAIYYLNRLRKRKKIE